MADYKGIKGFTIPNVSSDPSNPIIGQIWYNSTTDTLKGAGAGVGAWAATNAINTARYTGGSAGTTGTSAMFFGGQAPGSYNFRAETEQYNGTSWSEVGDLNTDKRQAVGFGSQSDAMAVGGYAEPPTNIVDQSETWNGTSWSEGNNMGSKRYGCGAGGHSTSSAGLIWGGHEDGTAVNVTKTETYNGTSWTEVNDLATATTGSGGAGTQAAALSINTLGPPASGLCNRWDGTSWTTDGGTINTPRNYASQHGGTQTSAIYAGGHPTTPAETLTEIYDGTSWTEVADLTTGRYGLGGAAVNNTAALVFGGTQDPGPAVDASEEWTTPDITTVTVTTS